MDLAPRPKIKIMNITKTRQYHIDIAKGIAIILMVIGHSRLPAYPQNWIFSFHMPFFFLISGVLTDWSRGNFKEFIESKAKGLLVPFSIYSLMVIALAPLWSNMSIIECAEQVFCKGWGDLAFWFVPVLFIALIIIRLVMTLKNNIIISVVLVAGIIYLNFHNVVMLDWQLHAVLPSTLFVMIGALCSKWIKSLPKYKIIYVCIVVTPLSLIAPLVSHVDLAHARITPMIPGTICALAGSILLLCISLYISKLPERYNQWLIAIGRNTFVVLAFSQIVIMALNRNLPQLGGAKYIALILFSIGIVFGKNRIVRLFYSK